MNTRGQMAHALVVLLRSVVGDPKDKPTSHQIAKSVRHLLPSNKGLGPASWLVWCMAGIDLLSDDFQSILRVQNRAQGLVSGMLMIRTRGNMAQAAKLLGMSRKSFRDRLYQAGLYPWPGDGHRDPAPTTEGQPGDLALLLRGMPSTVEDGKRGLVWWTLEDLAGIGPAWLERDDRSDRLFEGWWVDRSTVEAYAKLYGHEFRCEGEPVPANVRASGHGASGGMHDGGLPHPDSPGRGEAGSASPGDAGELGGS